MLDVTADAEELTAVNSNHDGRLRWRRRRIAGRRTHGCRISANAWGSNLNGQLVAETYVAEDETGVEFSSTPLLVEGLSGVESVSVGGAHSLAVTTDGDLYAWGSNGLGQLWDGTRETRFTPAQVGSHAVDEAQARRAGVFRLT